MPGVIPPSRSNLDVGQIWEVGGVLMGLTSPNSPVIVGQEFSASAAPRSDSFSCWLWISSQQCPVSFQYYSQILVSVVSLNAGNKHPGAVIEKEIFQLLCGNNNNTVGCWWEFAKSVWPLPICSVGLMNLFCPFSEDIVFQHKLPILMDWEETECVWKYIFSK